MEFDQRNLIMEFDHGVGAWSLIMEFDHGTCRNLAAGFACVAICSKNNHVLQLFDLCVCLVVGDDHEWRACQTSPGFCNGCGEESGIRRACTEDS